MKIQFVGWTLGGMFFAAIEDLWKGLSALVTHDEGGPGLDGHPDGLHALQSRGEANGCGVDRQSTASSALCVSPIHESTMDLIWSSAAQVRYGLNVDASSWQGE